MTYLPSPRNSEANCIKITGMKKNCQPTLIEAVPNFSDGRNPETIEALRNAVRLTPSVRLVNVHQDADHNRSVFTLIGEGEPLRECALNLVGVAAERIDLETQRGVHPRIGATDVVPFVPLRNASMDDCVRLAREAARQISERYPIPTYLYALASIRPDRTKLSELRRGNYEGLKTAIENDPYFEPDFGPKRLASAGATAVGARPILIAYNVFLVSNRVDHAKEIAKKIRESSGGLPGVQALGLPVGGRAQVSTNLLDYRKTPLNTLFAAVRTEAEKLGESVERAELIGCLPAAALEGVTPEEIGLFDWDESRLLDRSVG